MVISNADDKYELGVGCNCIVGGLEESIVPAKVLVTLSVRLLFQSRRSSGSFSVTTRRNAEGVLFRRYLVGLHVVHMILQVLTQHLEDHG